MQSEVKKLQEQIETEVRLRQDTDEKLAKMNQLLATGQEALQLEKKTVELVRQQVVSQTPTKVSQITHIKMKFKIIPAQIITKENLVFI